jgi:hypothetical protein
MTLRSMRNQVIWSDENKIELFVLNAKPESAKPMSGGNLKPGTGMFFSGRDWETTVVRIEGKMNGAKYSEMLDENLLQSAQDLRLGQRFAFQQDNNPKQTAKTTHEWLRD